MTLALLAALAALALPGAAHAASTKPAVVTKAPSNIGQSSVQMNGSVDPNGAVTTYFFQIGTTTLYGSNSAETPIGNGTKPTNVSAPAEGLAPATRYHYRIVARNRNGLVKGKDRTFKTRRQPLGLTLNASANPVSQNASLTLNGLLTGTGNAGQQVVLQANPWPYTQGFLNTGNVLVTNPDGGFQFPLIGVQGSTQYRVLMPNKPAVVSPIVSLGVKVHVTTRATPRRVRSRHRVQFSGTITPAVDGQQVIVQKLVGTGFKTVAQTFASHRNSGSSGYRKRVKVRHSGSYRVVVVPANTPYVPNVGRTIKIRIRH